MQQSLIRHSATTRAHVLDLYEQGGSAAELSSRFGVPKPTIYCWVHDASAERPALRRGRRHAPEARDLAVKLYGERVPMEEISARVGAPIPTIYWWAQKAGVSRPWARARQKR